MMILHEHDIKSWYYDIISTTIWLLSWKIGQKNTPPFVYMEREGGMKLKKSWISVVYVMKYL